jgi:molecular chaperone DnaK
VAEHDRARAEMLVGDARQALQSEDTPLERLRELTGELQQIAQALAASASGPSAQPQGPPDGEGQDDDDVIDAEFSTS